MQGCPNVSSTSQFLYNNREIYIQMNENRNERDPNQVVTNHQQGLKHKFSSIRNELRPIRPNAMSEEHYPVEDQQLCVLNLIYNRGSYAPLYTSITTITKKMGKIKTNVPAHNIYSKSKSMKCMKTISLYSL